MHNLYHSINARNKKFTLKLTFWMRADCFMAANVTAKTESRWQLHPWSLKNRRWNNASVSSPSKSSKSESSKSFSSLSSLLFSSDEPSSLLLSSNEPSSLLLSSKTSSSSSCLKTSLCKWLIVSRTKQQQTLEYLSSFILCQLSCTVYMSYITVYTSLLLCVFCSLLVYYVHEVKIVHTNLSYPPLSNIQWKYVPCSGSLIPFR